MGDSWGYVLKSPLPTRTHSWFQVVFIVWAVCAFSGPVVLRGTGLYPVFANVAVVVLVLTPVLCRRVLSWCVHTCGCRGLCMVGVVSEVVCACPCLPCAVWHGCVILCRVSCFVRGVFAHHVGRPFRFGSVLLRGHVFVCMCVRVHVRMCVCVNVCMCVCMFECAVLRHSPRHCSRCGARSLASWCFAPATQPCGRSARRHWRRQEFKPSGVRT
jgi:hypothetical protein